MGSERARFADRLFSGIAPQYDRMASVLSMGQDARWRRALIAATNVVPGGRVLDAAAGTQLVAREFAARRRVRVVALDQNEAMLGAGAEPNRLAGLDDRVALVLGRADVPPFAEDAFDAVTFTYLLRYVDDPAATVGELVRVLRPGGSIAMLEFHVPPSGAVRAGWWMYTRLVMPVLGAIVSPAWARTAAFLGPSISRFVAEHPVERWVRWFQAAGIVHVRTRTFLLGTAIVLSGVKRG